MIFTAHTVANDTIYGAFINFPSISCCDHQYVRARLKGAVRPDAILVPQRAVQQGGRGHFVWLVGKDGKAALRPVVVGDWQGDHWFISEGLQAGDQVVVDGAQRLAQGAAVTVVARAASAPAPAASRP